MKYFVISYHILSDYILLLLLRVALAFLQHNFEQRMTIQGGKREGCDPGRKFAGKRGAAGA